jgi:uncharacterized protein (TIGR02266 family)
MLDERRRGPRARIPGAKVTCESASGGRLSGRVFDIGKGGMFVQFDRRPPVGARLTLEIQVPGELATWPALGRVVWVRESATVDKPAGAGVTFIDVDEAVLAAIGRLLVRFPPSPTSRADAAPERERTVLGVGALTARMEAAPIVAVAPPRERTVQGLAPPPTSAPSTPRIEAPPPRDEMKTLDFGELKLDADGLPVLPPEPEASRPEPLDAAQAEPEDDRPTRIGPPPDAMAGTAPRATTSSVPSARPRPLLGGREDSIAPAGVPRRRSRSGLAVLLSLALVVAASYVGRDELRPYVTPYIGPVMALIAPARESAASAASSEAPAAPSAAPGASAAPAASSATVPKAPALGFDAEAGGRATMSAAAARARPVALAVDAGGGVAVAKPFSVHHLAVPAQGAASKPASPAAAPAPERPAEPSGDNPY